MILSQRRRLLIGLLIAGLIAVTAASVAFSQWLDPGDKGDTSTDLVEMRGITFDGVFPVQEGAITLEPVGDELRVIVRLNIDVDSVETGNPGLNQVLRAAMATGDYPLAFYVATSRELVPVTEKEIRFMLDGELEVHNVAYEHLMSVNAQLVDRNMWAIATSDLDLANHGVEFPAFVGSTVIQLTARLQMVEAESIHQSGGPG
jgi:polyisoprenoid-binding protein YceI